ncbi:MAG: 3-oxoacyl-[acyl-carrier-protein] synthase III C-terminal domain-containing protein [Pseudomonadota bacterium]
MAGITGYGGYIPRLRLSRQAIATANVWMNPNIMGQGKGERAMANWDEDSVTMAAEAARDCLGEKPRNTIDALNFASTTMPFADRLNAAIVSGALSLDEDVAATDFGASQRAGATALRAALNAVNSGESSNALVVAGEHRLSRAGSPQEMNFGDGAAAFTVGNDEVIAEYLGGHVVTLDFVDHFRGEGEKFDYYWEERWIRDEGYNKIVPNAVAKALEKSGVNAEEINYFIMPCTLARVADGMTKKCGLSNAAVRDNLHAGCGDTGAAHALVMLSHALQEAEPGQKIMVASFGQGCDVMIFETTNALKHFGPQQGIAGALQNGKEETNYLKFLTFNGLLEFEKGMRAEADKKTALSVLYRKQDLLESLVGGKCRECGTPQLPRNRVCIECRAVDSQDPYPFADKEAKVLSWSADYLTYCIDPPQHYGMMVFEEGGRLMMDFTDVEVGSVDSGMSVKMMFRIKDFDDKRGFRRYFWKAAPV